MKHNVLAVMALVNGLAQANRFSWQSESQAEVDKNDYNQKSTEVVKPEGQEQWLHGLFGDYEKDKEGEEEKQQSKLDHKKLKHAKEKLLDEEDEEETEYEEKEYKHDKNNHHDHGYHKGHHGYNDDPKKYNTYDHYKPAVTNYPGHYNHHGHHTKGYEYTYKPVTKHHTYTKVYEPKLPPKCYGDRCDRKSCKKCGDDWAQPGCWHCKNHEGDYGYETKTKEYAPEKTDDKYNDAKTYTHKGVTVIVPKPTKAPEAPKVEKPKKEHKYEDICRKVIKGHGEHKYEETICDRVEHYKEEQPKKEQPKKEQPKNEQPKEEHKHHDICRKVIKSHGEHKHEVTICDKIEHQKEEQPSVYVESKKENVCDKIKGCHAPAPAPAPKPHYHEVKPIPVPVPAPQPDYPKKEDICDKVKGCTAPQPQYPEVKPVPAPAPAHQPQYHEVKPVPVPVPVPEPQPQYPEVKPVPAPGPHYPKVEVKPVPVPAPQPQYPEKEDICDKIKGCPAPQPQPQPQPRPQYPKVEPIPAPAPLPKPEEIKPVPVPAPAPPASVPVQPEQVQPEGEEYEEAPTVPLTVSKSDASYNTVSIAGTVVVGIVGMILL